MLLLEAPRNALGVGSEGGLGLRGRSMEADWRLESACGGPGGDLGEALGVVGTIRPSRERFWAGLSFPEGALRAHA